MANAHPHVELMALYVEDARETYRPWERWEVQDPEYGMWVPLRTHPRWMPTQAYRRKAHNAA